NIHGRGEAIIYAKPSKNSTTRIRLQDTCHVPHSTPSIISVARLDEADCYTVFGAGRCITFKKADKGNFIQQLMKTETTLLTGTMTNHLYRLDDTSPPECSYATKLETQNESQLEVLHRWLGHLNYSAVKSLATKDLIEGIRIPK